MLYRRSARLRRVFVKSRLVLRRLARTRSARAAAQLGKALHADIADLADSISRRAVAHPPSLEWKWETIRAHAKLRGSKEQKWLPYAAGLILLLIPAAALVWILHDLPFAQVVKGGADRVILLEMANGQPLARKGPFRAPDKALNELPPHLIDAVISIEDKRFYSHNGIDAQAMLRAFGSNMKAGAIVQGGSTITQQLVKILYLDRRQTLARKIREVALALWLEAKLSKHEILTRYLNNVYLGAGATGVPAAALVYFGKDASDLTLAESALLAGLIVAPSYLNPRHNPDAARARAVLVLDAMVANGKLDETTARAAKDRPARLVSKPFGIHAGTWFADWVYGEAVEIAGSFQGAMRVRTTLVPSLQALAEKVVARALARHSKAKEVTQAALVAMLPNGAVVAMVGGRDYQKSEFNRAVQAMRQPGSAFKLFVYYAALRSGISPMDRIEDAPLEIDGWSPENFGGDFRGRVSIAEAFARSLNAATVRLALEVGLDEVIAAARDLGLDAPLQKIPSLALGSSEVSLLDLTGAYASVRAGVAPIEPWGIAALGTDERAPLFKVGPVVRPARSLKPYDGVLVGLLKLVVDRGTGRAAALDGFAAGKTGTSQNYRDAWFIGFNEWLVVGVWVGNDDDTPMENMTGGKLPALIWKRFMSEALNMAAAGEGALVGEARADPGVESGCNYRACARAYRSFRSSDCSYQPYSGPRRLCDK
jgi:penicillin-binding protein 1A